MSVRTLGALSLAAMASACGGARGGHVRGGHDVGGPRAGGGGRSSVAAPASPQLAERFDSLARTLGSQGVQYDGIVSSGFITHGSNVTTPIDVPAGSCLSIIAIASSSIHDLDAHLFDADGTVVVEDIENDPHPTVQICATEPRRYYHVIETFVSDSNASEGHGAYAIAAYRSDRHGLEAVARAIGGHPGSALSTNNNGSDAERRLSELREGIGRRGFVPNADTIRATFTAPGSIRYPVTVTADRCYTYAALAEGSLNDVDLSVFDADGEEIARDIRPERDAFVQLCPASAGSLQVEIRARPASGVVFLQSFAADAASVGGANTLWLGERMAWQASSTALPQSIEATRAMLESQGFAHPTTSPTTAFAPGESHDQRVTLEAGRCTAIAAPVGRGLGRMGIAANAATNGDFLARGTFHGSSSIAVLCPSTREEVLVRLRAEVGTGDAALLTATGNPPPAWTGGADRVAVSEAMATNIGQVVAGWHAEGAPERVHIGARALRTRDADLAANVCTRFAVSAGAGLPTVSLTLRAANGNVIAQGSNDGTAIVTRCTQAAERVRLEITIDPPSAAEYDAFVSRYTRRGGS